MKKITIIGAGIGGLTTAIALKKEGFDVEIYESTPEFKKAGSGINLAMNAMQVFKLLGVYDDIISHSNQTFRMNSTRPDLSLLASADFGPLESEFGVKNVAIHRAALHEILVQHLGDTPIHLHKRLKTLSEDAEGVTLVFEDGSTVRTDVVIGADGIHSHVRKAIFPESALRDAEQVCWRGIVKTQLNRKYASELNEAWGKGSRFGFVHISPDEIYWYALIDKDRFTSRDVDLAALFSEYHPDIQRIIRDTPPEAILFNEIWDLQPIETWHKGRVCLTGDAAHATTPNMGQGAVQAVESALALSITLKQESTVEAAFKRFQELRFEKANYVIKTSWRLGKLAQISNPLPIFLRNFIVRIVPAKAVRKQNRKLFTLTFLPKTGRT